MDLREYRDVHLMFLYQVVMTIYFSSLKSLTDSDLSFTWLSRTKGAVESGTLML